MSLHALALPLILALSFAAVAFARRSEPPRDPDEIERGSTTIMPEDR